LLAFTNDKVTGAAITSIIPTPTTSVVFIGEFPSRKSPCEVEMAKATHKSASTDWLATHQLI
jgi:hypothetical protein